MLQAERPVRKHRVSDITIWLCMFVWKERKNTAQETKYQYRVYQCVYAAGYCSLMWYDVLLFVDWALLGNIHVYDV